MLWEGSRQPMKRKSGDRSKRNFRGETMLFLFRHLDFRWAAVLIVATSATALAAPIASIHGTVLASTVAAIPNAILLYGIPATAEQANTRNLRCKQSSKAFSHASQPFGFLASVELS
jgi:hypothetical protein